MPSAARRTFHDYTYLLATHDPMALYFHLAFATGMRPNELLGLRWEDVDLDASQLTVRWALERVENKWAWKEPKAHSRRTIPLPAPLVERLRRHKAAQAARILERRRKGLTYLHHGLVFAGRFGEPMEARNVSCRNLKPILKAAKLPESFRLYDTRHTCATLLAAAGENPKVIAERLGHRDATLTLNVYTHVAPQMQERATATLGDAITGRMGTTMTSKSCRCGNALRIDEVTQEMIAAAYWTIAPYLGDDGDAEEILTRVYRQMSDCARGNSGCGGTETG